MGYDPRYNKPAVDLRHVPVGALVDCNMTSSGYNAGYVGTYHVRWEGNWTQESVKADQIFPALVVGHGKMEVQLLTRHGQVGWLNWLAAVQLLSE